jgi:energy-coupling factor transporter ATP-binding protein EcfA2
MLVVGPSGSGKSTLALALAGLVPHEVTGRWLGSLEVDGLDVARGPRPAIAERVGLLFQDPASQLVMDTVEDDVAFGLENRAWPTVAMPPRVTDALIEVGLGGFEARRPGRLSGGEQQRLALAGVLAPQPGIIVLDEPTANLDPAGARAFFDRLAELRDARATTVVLIEHRVDAAWPLADVVLALGRDGRPIDIGPPDEVLVRSGRRMAEAGIWLPVGTEVRPAPARSEIETLFAQARPVVDAVDSGPVLLEARGVRFGYVRRYPVVVDVDIRLRVGERITLVGPNGSGKSTLGRLLVGLLNPDSGRIRLGDSDPARLPPERLARRASYVFQDPERQFLASTVRDEVELGLTEPERARAEDLMEQLGLPLATFSERSPYRLSGGEQRRLSLACVLVRRPELLVLDEPTFGQDRDGYEGLLGILRERVDRGTTVLAATHDERFVADFGGRRLVMEEGRLGGPTETL